MLKSHPTVSSEWWRQWNPKPSERFILFLSGRLRNEAAMIIW